MQTKLVIKNNYKSNLKRLIPKYWESIEFSNIYYIYIINIYLKSTDFHTSVLWNLKKNNYNMDFNMEK